MTRSILILDDDPSLRMILHEALTRAGYHVTACTQIAELLTHVEAGLGEAVIADVMLPDGNGFEALDHIRCVRPELPVIIISAQNTILTALEASNRGAYEYLPKPFDIADLLSAVSGGIARYDQAQQTQVENTHADTPDLPLIGRSPPMQEVFRTIAKVMNSNLTVMILGESGTGKERVARVLHDFGPRRTHPFVALNMAAIPRDLIESELFGYEKGAFTGAIRRFSGKFEQAQGGTLFLDEIGDMPLEAQTRLLRVLQEGEYNSLGSHTPLRADVRIMTATHKDLRSMVAEGRFREDLFYRLNVVPIHIPPLRVRGIDIVDLANHFLVVCAEEGLPAKTLSQDALDWLLSCHWPGNVRQLENLIRRVCALCRDDVVPVDALFQMGEAENFSRPVTTDVLGIKAFEKTTESFPETSKTTSEEIEQAAVSVLTEGGLAEAIEAHLLRYFMTFGDDDLPPDGLYDRILLEVERPLFKLTLARTQGNQMKAAKLLGINRNTLRKKLNVLKMKP